MNLDQEAGHRLAELNSAHLLREPRIVEARRGAEVLIAGRWLINVSSNDYLGLADHPDIRQAGIDCLHRIGGSSASRLVVGNHAEHAELEASLRSWLDFGGACLFNSGVAANTGVVSALTGTGDLILSDQLNHASIIDGCRLSRAETQVYRHCDVQDLEARLRGAGNRRVFVVTESLFSMDGGTADLVAIDAMCHRYGAALIVDEAHALGALGPLGRGLCAHFGVKPDVIVGTFGKALGVYGAFAVGSENVTKLLWNRARSLIFTTGLPPSLIAMCSQALRIIVGDEGELRRQQLDRIVAVTSVMMTNHRLGKGQSHIVPILCGDEHKALALAASCNVGGYLALAIRPPTVPVGSSRIRICLRSDLAVGQIESLAALIAQSLAG